MGGGRGFGAGRSVGNDVGGAQWGGTLTMSSDRIAGNDTTAGAAVQCAMQDAGEGPLG